MQSRNKSYDCVNQKKRFWQNENITGLMFHVVGLASLLWFLFRVVPAPHRIRYPCQQMSLSVVVGYLTFWSIIFVGVRQWMKQMKRKTAALIPLLIVSAVFVGTLSGPVFADTYLSPTSADPSWNPLSKDPMGTPRGLHPGRVVWVWDPDATAEKPVGYWWQNANNDQTVIEKMIESGITGLTDESTIFDAWDALFRDFNQNHGKGDVGYQPGEKIAIKVNLNNCWSTFINPYIKQDNERDASPQLTKALLRQLTEVVGVKQQDITVYDASRDMGNWFYNRVYYKKHPAVSPVAEFPEVHFVDMEGGAPGREKVQSSDELIYFSDGLTRTLPTCVAEAAYLINTPILKKHPIQNGVTLSGKNFFGTWIESVADVHPYHKSGLVMGNPTPQTDLLAHEHVGGKTLLFLGDGLYGTLQDHRTLAKFQMYPFNNDWTNSLFFSQDPVAVDSVMFDFLNYESDPIEGSQNYLHQSAEPPSNVYDPEDDGVFVSESLGVHEHWDTSVDIFSDDRYVGPAGDGIDIVIYGAEHAESGVVLLRPRDHTLYLMNMSISLKKPFCIVIGKIELSVQLNNIEQPVDAVEFYVDGELLGIDATAPYTLTWDARSFSRYALQVKAISDTEQIESDVLVVWKFF